jgi:hypothetical protein
VKPTAAFSGHETGSPVYKIVIEERAFSQLFSQTPSLNTRLGINDDNMTIVMVTGSLLASR